MIQPTAEQFTEQAWGAVVAAQGLAQEKRQQQLETEHLLLALLQQPQGLGVVLRAPLEQGPGQRQPAGGAQVAGVQRLP